MPTLDVHHLVELADRPAGKAYLGEIVGRLVYATVAKRRPTLHFLGGDTHNYAGWDGWVEVSVEVNGASVMHRSLWELSTDKKAEAKIRRDYEATKKKAAPHGWDTREVIYVAATLRSLTSGKKEKLKKELIKKHGMRWAGIVILDAGDFVRWIASCPAVEDWIAVEFHVGNRRFGRALEHAWNEWSGQTKPGLTTELTLAGRDTAPLLAALKFDASQAASLQCDSNDEAVAMVFCAAKSLSTADSQLTLANALVVRDDAAARSLLDQAAPPDGMPIVVLVPPATTQSERFIKAGYRVVHAFGRREASSTVVSFERAGVQEFAKALTQSMGMVADEAETQARACGCSVAVWHIRNLFKNSLQPSLPPWADAAHADLVVPAVFVGGWQEISKPDSGVIKLLADLEASQFSSRLQQFTHGPTALLEFIGTERFVIAPTAAFEFVIRSITRQHVEKLELACREVFSTISPEAAAKWEGKPSELRVHNARDELSSQLLDGLAETLLRIAVLGAPLQGTGVLGPFGSAQAFVDHLVRSLPGLSNDVRLLASLDRQLPYLIEAAPAVFFEALESLIQGRPSDLKQFLGDEAGVFGRAFHTGLLWGLEGLAWSAEYLPRVAAILLDLAALDPGGQLSNRPFNSLAEIFLPWHPGTACLPAERTELLRQLVSRNSEQGWRLLLELLPGKRQISHNTHKPKWRNLGQAGLPAITRRQVFETYQLYVGLALQAARGDPLRLAQLVGAYPNLSSEQRADIELMLDALPLDGVAPHEVYKLWQRMHKLVAHHRGFHDAKWALPAEVLERLEKLMARFASSDPIIRNRWLFDDQFPETGFSETDYEGRRHEVEKRRQSALLEVIQVHGWNGVHQLIKSVRYSYIVGHVAAEIADTHDVLLQAMNSWQAGNSREEMFAFQAASGVRQRLNGEDWTTAMLSFARSNSWSPEKLGTAILDYSDTKATYEIVQTLGGEAEQFYWRHRYAFIHAAEHDDEAFEMAARALLKHGRAYELVDQDWHRIAKMGYAAVLEVLDALVEQLSAATDISRSGTIGHDVQHLFAWLRKQPEAKSEDIARREYALLPLLTSYGEEANLSLHELMRNDAAFFVDVICDLYRAASDEKAPEGDALVLARAKANAAYHILESWRTPPGVEGVKVDEKVLNSWVDLARSLLHGRDRADIGDQQIGKLLHYTPAEDSDKAWPSIPIRNLLQRLQAEHIERGIVLENFNSRGVTSRAMFEGGGQERELEARWREYADRMGARWSRAKAVCVEIADQWRRQAEQEDEHARSQRTKYSR